VIIYGGPSCCPGSEAGSDIIPQTGIYIEAAISSQQFLHECWAKSTDQVKTGWDHFDSVS
jgi:hypothetical protein